MKKITFLSLSTILFLSTVNAQDSQTIKVKETKETTITRDSANVTTTKKPVAVDSVAKTAQPVQPVQEQKEEPPRLHNLELGLRFLPTFSSLAVRTYNGEIIQGATSMNNGYGFMLGYNFTKYFGIQMEVNYLKTSQKYKDRDLERIVNVNYVNIPVLLSFNTNKSKIVNWNFVIGPQFGINVGSSTSSNSNGSTDTLNAVVAVKQGDVGLAYGTGLEFMLNKMRTFRIDAGFRGFYGLVNMDGSNNNANSYNVIVNASRKTYGAYIGLTFLF